MTKYTVGDKVRVREDLKFGVNFEYHMENSRVREIATSKMVELSGKVVTIEKNDRGGYRIKEDRDRFNWVDEMFVDNINSIA